MSPKHQKITEIFEDVPTLTSLCVSQKKFFFLFVLADLLAQQIILNKKENFYYPFQCVIQYVLTVT